MAPAVAAVPTTTPSPAPSAPQRPGYVPEAHWDGTTGKVKDEAALAEHYNTLTARVAAEDSRKASALQKPEDAKLELPPDFKMPEGMGEWKWNEADPLIVKARELAVAKQMTQTDFTDFMGLYAATQVAQTQQFDTARAAEVAKLGATAPQRITAVTTWLKAMGGEDAAPLAKVLEVAPVAGTIIALEKLIARFGTQGAGAPGASGRVAADANVIPGYDKMTFEQRRHAQDRARAGGR